ncbi:MAG TPA: hypothetical protein VEV13_05110 [Candidatus Limnocylindria bacterium]|nr:hypothetical protein [Candidatus Limnocylindria bacterium]
MEAIRTVVQSLQPRPGWVQDSGVAYDCESVNLDCSNSSSGVQFTHAGSVADACAGLVSWVTAEPSFVEPSAVVGLAWSAPPSAADC